ncbi:hypothetical protein [Pseudomonas sp. FEN]|uniref:hypothetical protein n=1 Tax=Pseudomonas sp. FEN TaxID=2767468 RepID=UPI00174A03CF|nr:hypothetical protein [Pseudomonas sp. FEN]CAD5203858.1 hypothetical protein [Pseudomonas sp. FEN]
MKTKPITSADIANVTGYTRHQLRGLLNELPAYQAKAERARVAREYSKHDLAVITICCELEARFGLRRDAIVSLSQDLARALLGPRPNTQEAYLIIQVCPSAVQFVEHVPSTLREGLVISLREIFARVDGYLVADYLPGLSQQQLLDLGLQSVTPNRKKNRVQTFNASETAVKAGARRQRKQ